MSKGSRQRRDRISREKPYIQYRKARCERCGKNDDTEWKIAGGYKFKSRDRNPLTAHHIDGNAENNNPENIQTLCRKCHDKIHNII